MSGRSGPDLIEGVLAHGLPYRAFGSGRPLLLLRWFAPDNTNPTGLLGGTAIDTRHALVACEGRSRALGNREPRGPVQRGSNIPSMW